MHDSRFSQLHGALPRSSLGQELPGCTRCQPPPSHGARSDCAHSLSRVGGGPAKLRTATAAVRAVCDRRGWHGGLAAALCCRWLRLTAPRGAESKGCPRYDLARATGGRGDPEGWGRAERRRGVCQLPACAQRSSSSTAPRAVLCWRLVLSSRSRTLETVTTEPLRVTGDC